MATREVQYAADADGYNAMVADFTEMFSWDAVEADENGGNFTIFKKSCGEKSYVGLRVSKIKDNTPVAVAIACNGTTTFVTTPRNNNEMHNTAYAYGSGFFAFCGSPSSMPNSGWSSWGGISTCRNILTGETGWCAFAHAYTASYASQTDYYMLTKDTKVHNTSSFTDWCLSLNVRIGAAASLHDPLTGNVADKILLLTAIPDTLLSCITPVIFNGTRYTRLGCMLVPAD